MKPAALIILTIILTGLSGSFAYGTETVKAKTDQRVELLSVVFRLAGNEEYNMNQFKGYVDDINQWFGPHKDHPVVAMARRLRITRGVSFDAVMSMAVHISQPPELQPLIPFNSGVPEPRWGKKGGLQFLRLLRDFYQESNFKQFYANHQAMYTVAETRMDTLLTKVNFGWFEKFYGVKSGGRFNLILGIGNGGGNYGPKVVYPDGGEDLYAVMGTWIIDQGGIPNYDGSVLGTIIHEFNHSFANPLVNSNLPLLKGPGDTLFQEVKKQMSAMAYGNWKTVMYESLVRASTIQYFIDAGLAENQIKRLTVNEMSNGFLWMEPLVASLGAYKIRREKYPSLVSYMPQIAALYSRLAPDIGQFKTNFESRCARVQDLTPFLNGATDVDTAITEIKIRFDKPLNPKSGYSINYGTGGRDHFALSGNPEFTDDGRHLIIHVALKPDWDYSFILTSKSFRTMDEFPLVSYEVKFRTKKE